MGSVPFYVCLDRQITTASGAFSPEAPLASSPEKAAPGGRGGSRPARLARSRGAYPPAGRPAHGRVALPGDENAVNGPSVRAAAVLGVTLAAGIALAGYFVGEALFAARAAERYVTVKGFAEREVAANLAIWPIVFSVTGNDLGATQQRLEGDAAKITAFLAAQGFKPEEWNLSAPRVTDHAQGFVEEGRRPLERYLVEATVALRTPQVEAARRAIAKSGDLVRDGVRLIRSYEYNTQYLYTDLEAIKPEMIAAATRDARRAAEQFAQDSGSRVGSIRNAQQGFFAVEDRDPFSPEFKKIRVVTTVQYFLADD